MGSGCEVTAGPLWLLFISYTYTAHRPSPAVGKGCGGFQSEGQVVCNGLVSGGVVSDVRKSLLKKRVGEDCGVCEAGFVLYWNLTSASNQFGWCSLPELSPVQLLDFMGFVDPQGGERGNNRYWGGRSS